MLTHQQNIDKSLGNNSSDGGEASNDVSELRLISSGTSQKNAFLLIHPWGKRLGLGEGNKESMDHSGSTLEGYLPIQVDRNWTFERIHKVGLEDRSCGFRSGDSYQLLATYDIR